MIKNTHAEGVRPVGHLLADAAKAHQAQCPILGAHAHLPVPHAPMHLLVLTAKIPGEPENTGHDVLRHSSFNLPEGTDKANAQFAAGIHIYCIIANTPAGDQFQIGASLQQCSRIAFQTGDDHIRIPYAREQLFSTGTNAQLPGTLVIHLESRVLQKPQGSIVLTGEIAR